MATIKAGTRPNGPAGATFGMEKGPSWAPPGVAILTGGQLSGLPETADLLPAGLAETWGAEFDQRDADGLIFKALAPALGLIGAAALCGLVVYGVSRVNWNGLVGAVVLLFLFLLFLVFRNLKRSIFTFFQALSRQPLKVWLIFSPGRVVWLRKTVNGRRELVLDPAEITRLTLVPFEPVKYRNRPAPEPRDPFERILQKPVWPEKPSTEPPGRRLLILHYRLTDDEPAGPPEHQQRAEVFQNSERSETIMFERGQSGLCAWAAGLIQAAALPRSVPFEEMAATPTDPRDFNSFFRKDKHEQP